MTIARSQIISLENTPYYHCMARCVRRAFLCGEDKLTGQNFDHRKQWLIDRFKFLSSVFAIDICAYAIMSNHYHLVLYINSEQAKQWTEQEIQSRWKQVFKQGSVLVDRYLDPKIKTTKAENSKAQEVLELWRERLTNISWYMRCLNETISRMANKEDGVKGHFWEGRFKSQALLDEQAVLACMVYVDLNPIRAGVCDTPETAEFTSIYERIQQQTAKIQNKAEKKTHKKSDKNIKHAPLALFAGNPCEQTLKGGIPCEWLDYLELVDWTGRVIRMDKKGAIPKNTPKILKRLNIRPDQWQKLNKHFRQHFAFYIGTPESLQKVNNIQDKKWCKGSEVSEQLWNTTCMT
jgi:REP element-mobilizing transposase RayT